MSSSSQTPAWILCSSPPIAGSSLQCVLLGMYGKLLLEVGALAISSSWSPAPSLMRSGILTPKEEPKMTGEHGDDASGDAKIGNDLSAQQVDLSCVVAGLKELLFWWLCHGLVLAAQLLRLLQLAVGHCELCLQVALALVSRRALDVAADLAREGLRVCLLISRCLSLACLGASVGEVRIREGPLVEGAASAELAAPLAFSSATCRDGLGGLGWAGLGCGVGWGGMIWCGMVWYGYGAVWCGMVWCGMVRWCSGGGVYMLMHAGKVEGGGLHDSWL